MNVETEFLVDIYTGVLKASTKTVRIRMFPFGKIHKGDKVFELTPEVAGTFRLPHFKPPLKLGSHNDATPSGGSFTGLEVGVDGLYGLVSLNEEGMRSIEKREYRYHSPEIVMGGKGIQNPKTGEFLEGPLLVGAALLHNPHLGEDAALYSVEPTIIDRGTKMAEGQTSVPTPLWEVFMTWFKGQGEAGVTEVQDTNPDGQPDKYEAQIAGKDTEITALKAEVAGMQEAQTLQERIEHFTSEVEGESDEVYTLLAELSEDDAKFLVTRFKALKAETKLNPEETAGARGSDEEPMGPVDALEKAVEEYMTEHKVGYVQAFDMIRTERPEMFSGKEGE